MSTYMFCMVNRVRDSISGLDLTLALPVRFECSTFEHSIGSPTFGDGSFIVRHPKAICLCVEFVRAHVHACAQILFQFLFLVRTFFFSIFSIV